MSETKQVRRVLYNPFDPTQTEDPYPIWAELRAHAPLTQPSPGLYVAVHHEDVRAILSDAQLWSSRLNNTAVPLSEETNRMLALSQLDAPEHDRQRTSVAPAFAGAAIAELTPVIRRLAEGLAERLQERIEAQGQADFVQVFARPLARAVLAAFEGVRCADEALFFRWTQSFSDLLGYRNHPEWSRFQAWAQAVVKRPQALLQPDAPLSSRLFLPRAAAKDSVAMHDDELITFLYFLVVAGVANVRHALGNLMWRLTAGQPLAQTVAGADLGLLVEESLRLDPPALWQMRTAKRPTQLAGQEIAAGARVIAVTASANRDERYWQRPNEFWPERPGLRSHLTFGRGLHGCLGAGLTRLQLRTALEVLLERSPDLIQVPDARYRKAGDLMSRGPAELSVHSVSRHSVSRRMTTQGTRQSMAQPSPRTSEDASAERWLRHYTTPINPTHTLICFPHAGGSAVAFQPWARLMPAQVELLAVQYPGRLDRIHQPVLDSLSALADSASEAIIEHLTRRAATSVVLFGHSMGAAVAFEVAARVGRTGLGDRLYALVVSGRPGPTRHRGGDVHLREDEQVIEELARLGGAPKTLLMHPEMRALMLPTVRADYRAIETYRPEPGLQLQCPIHAFGGTQDPEADHAALESWAHSTRSDFSLRLFPGGHFYLVSEVEQVVSQVIQLLGIHRAQSPRRRTLSLP